MQHYAFTVHVSGIDATGSAYEDKLYEAGCDDALIVVVDGELSLDFDREGPSYAAAVASAAEDVRKAGGTVISVEPIQE